jgi:hypothetical protein
MLHSKYIMSATQCIKSHIMHMKYTNLLKNYWIFGLCPSSGILETKKNNILETGFISILGWEEKTPTQLRPLGRANLNHWTLRLRLNFLEAEVGVGKSLLCWLLRTENLWTWITFCLLNIFLNEHLTAVKIRCWSELFTDDLTRF